MFRKILFTLTIILLPLSANAQYVRLNSATDNAALYFSADRVFSYNRYDGAHFEVALYFAYPNDNSERGRTSLHQWQLSAFGGYGQRSQTASYGGSIALQSKGKHRWRPILAYSHELRQTGATTLGDYHVLDIAQNAVYMTDRYAQTDIISFGLTGNATTNTYLAINLTHSMEQNLFAPDGSLLYGDKVNTPLLRYSEAHLRLTHHNRLSIDITGGTCHNDNHHPYLRTIVQYNRQDNIGSMLTLKSFAQAGHTTSSIYNRLFNLSGTWGCPIFFENTMMTISPNEFHAHLYARATLCLSPQKPLWNTPYSSPIPFIQISGMAGWLVDNHQLATHCVVDGFPLDAPGRGLLEPAIGIKRIIKWGLMEMGVAAAYRLTPQTAHYYRTDTTDNIAIMATAELTL